MTDFRANDSGGRSSTKELTLHADGRYDYNAGSDTSGSAYGMEGAAGGWGTAGSESSSGTWTATENSITFTPQGGQPQTFALEKRNHPQNPQDPMIVLDGQPFVTAEARAPW